MEPKKIERKDNSIVLVAIISLIIIIGLWYLNYYTLKNNKERGSFGDMFGVVNALFSGLAFAGIIITILLQRKELGLQRKELEDTREEFIKQNKTLKQQRFENTFFNMLNLQGQIIQAMQMGLSKGREVIDHAAGTLTKFLTSIQQYNVVKNDISATLLNNLHELIARSYLPSYYRQYENSFNHYFRHLYHIYKFVYFSDLTKEEKDFYASLIRAQLGQNELYLIAFNGIIEDYGYPKFTFLMREYDILKNFGWESIKVLSHQQLVQYKIINVEYPFNIPKPDQRNY